MVCIFFTQSLKTISLSSRRFFSENSVLMYGSYLLYWSGQFFYDWSIQHLFKSGLWSRAGYFKLEFLRLQQAVISNSNIFFQFWKNLNYSWDGQGLLQQKEGLMIFGQNLATPTIVYRLHYFQEVLQWKKSNCYCLKISSFNT